MPIQQHPIPQEVAGYKFRLIGDMTVKQFIWLAAGIILGIIFWSLPLPFFFKYPLAIISVALGAGSAFLPIQGRPMDKWLIAFIKSIYSPTQYVWSKGEVVAGPTIKAIVPPAPRSESQIPSIPSGAQIPRTSEIPGISTGPAGQPTPPTPPIREVTVPVEEVTKTATPVKPAVEPTLPPSPPPPIPAHPPAKAAEAAGEAPTQRLPIPFTPTSPNTLVGMTLTPEGKILPASLVEIKLRSNTIRATKSNQLGQFLFAKSLDNGLYQIATEKEGYTFDTYSINLNGQIVKPLKLQAKSANA